MVPWLGLGLGFKVITIIDRWSVKSIAFHRSVITIRPVRITVRFRIKFRVRYALGSRWSDYGIRSLAHCHQIATLKRCFAIYFEFICCRCRTLSLHLRRLCRNDPLQICHSYVSFALLTALLRILLRILHFLGLLSNFRSTALLPDRRAIRYSQSCISIRSVIHSDQRSDGAIMIDMLRSGIWMLRSAIWE